MNREELLQKIKDEVARENGRPNWRELLYWDSSSSGFGHPDLIDQVASRYAIAMCKKQKREMANVVSGGVGALHEVLKKAILETKNVAE